MTFREHITEWALQPKEYIFYAMNISVYKHLFQNALEEKKKKKPTARNTENVSNCKDALKS